MAAAAEGFNDNDTRTKALHDRIAALQVEAARRAEECAPEQEGGKKGEDDGTHPLPGGGNYTYAAGELEGTEDGAGQGGNERGGTGVGGGNHPNIPGAEGGAAGHFQSEDHDRLPVDGGAEAEKEEGGVDALLTDILGSNPPSFDGREARVGVVRLNNLYRAGAQLRKKDDGRIVVIKPSTAIQLQDGTTLCAMKLGGGVSSMVIVGQEKRSKTLVALKVLNSDHDKTLIIQEIQALKEASRCGHPHIVQFRDAFYCSDLQRVVIVTDLVGNGHLGQWLHTGTRKRSLSEAEAQQFLYQIGSAVHHLHGLGMVSQLNSFASFLF